MLTGTMISSIRWRAKLGHASGLNFFEEVLPNKTAAMELLLIKRFSDSLQVVFERPFPPVLNGRLNTLTLPVSVPYPFQIIFGTLRICTKLWRCLSIHRAHQSKLSANTVMPIAAANARGML